MMALDEKWKESPRSLLFIVNINPNANSPNNCCATSLKAKNDELLVELKSCDHQSIHLPGIMNGFLFSFIRIKWIFGDIGQNETFEDAILGFERQRFLQNSCIIQTHHFRCKINESKNKTQMKVSTFFMGTPSSSHCSAFALKLRWIG